MLMLLPYYKNSGKQRWLYLSEREVVGLWSSQQMYLFCFWFFFFSFQAGDIWNGGWVDFVPVGVAVTFNIKKVEVVYESDWEVLIEGTHSISASTVIVLVLVQQETKFFESVLKLEDWRFAPIY